MMGLQVDNPQLALFCTSFDRTGAARFLHVISRHHGKPHLQRKSHTAIREPWIRRIRCH